MPLHEFYEVVGISKKYEKNNIITMEKSLRGLVMNIYYNGTPIPMKYNNDPNKNMVV